MSNSSRRSAGLPWRSAGLSGAFVVLALLLAQMLPPAARSALAVSSLSGDGVIFSSSASAGPATPYPSTITVNGLAGSITNVTVKLTGFSHTFPDAVDLLLVGPNGKQVLLMSDAGGGVANALTGANLTFDDAAAQSLPNETLIAGDTSYRPTNYGVGDTFAAPAPPINAGTSLAAAYNLSDPNGNWQLFAVEDVSGTSGAITGWSLTIETADLAAEVGSTASVNAGSPLSYSVVVRNNGTQAVANPSVTISLPEGTSFSQFTAPNGWSCTAPAGGATSFPCTTPSLASGASATIGVELLVNQGLPTGTVITRSASISSAVAEANTTNNSSAETTTVTTLADLQVVEVQSPASVDAGATLATTIDIKNNGPSDAINPSLSLPVPANTTFVGMVVPAGWTCTLPAVGAAGEAVCTSAVLIKGPDATRFTIEVKVNSDLNPPATITSSAAISAATPDRPDTPGGTTFSNNSDTDAANVTTTANLAVAIDDTPDLVSSAADLAYEITVSNAGPSNAVDSVLETRVEPGTIFVGLVTPEGWSCPVKPEVGDIGVIRCTSPSFGVKTDTFVLTVHVLSGTPEGTVLSLDATVSTDTDDSDGTNDLYGEDTDVTVQADVAIALSGVGPAVKAASELAYQFSVNNAGPEQAEGVTLTTAVPAGTTFVALDAPDWDCTTPQVGATGQITCTTPALAVATSNLVLKVKLGQVPNNTALALSAAVAVQSPNDTRTNNNSATLNSTVVDAADIGVSVGGPTGAVRPGEVMNYSLQVNNAGPESALNTQLNLTTPANTTFVSLEVPAGWSCTTPAANGTGTISCANPAFGLQSDTFKLALRVSSVTENTTVNLGATVSSTSQDVTTANNSNSLTTAVIYRLRTYLPLVRR